MKIELEAFYREKNAETTSKKSYFNNERLNRTPQGLESVPYFFIGI